MCLSNDFLPEYICVTRFVELLLRVSECYVFIRRVGGKQLLFGVGSRSILFGYAFIGLAIVCDDYLVMSLEQVRSNF